MLKFRNASRVCCVLLAIIALSPFASNQTPDAESSLKQRFENQIFLIRGWYQDSNLKYDASGKVMGHPRPGSWTTSGVQIHSVAFRDDGVQLRGARVVLRYDKTTHKLGPVRLGSRDDLTITIKGLSRSNTMADFDLLEKAIFVRNATVADVPEYWRDFITHGEKDTTSNHADVQNLPEVIAGLTLDGQPVYRATGQHLTPPQILKKQEPEYPEITRNAGFEGTSLVEAVIDQKGEPKQIQIVRPVGFGLDDQAVKAVTNWKFSPALREGKPVAVKIRVEVNFRLR